jgi:Tfp pilus assembly protein PilF
MIWPLNLVPYYPYPRNSSYVSFEALSAVFLVIGITLLCAMMARKRKLLPAVWGYYVVTLIPVLGIVQVGHQEMADRYTYLPSIGPFLIAGLAVAWGSAKSYKSGNWPSTAQTLVLAGSIIIFTCLSAVTIRQIGIWKNSMVLWNYVIKMEQDKVPEAYYNRGLVFGKMGQLDRALADYDKSISLDPNFWGPYNNRGLVFYEIGQLDRAIADFDHAISLAPARAEAYYNRGLVFDKMGQLDKALADYDQALSLSPYDADAYNNRGRILSRRGQLDRAIADFDHAISLNPAYAEAYYNRGLAFQASGQPDKASRDFMAWKAYSAER